MKRTQMQKGTNYPRYNKTKIIATIGPATSSYEMLKKIITIIQTKYIEDSRNIPGYKPESNLNHNNRQTRRIKLTI